MAASTSGDGYGALPGTSNVGAALLSETDGYQQQGNAGMDDAFSQRDPTEAGQLSPQKVSAAAQATAGNNGAGSVSQSGTNTNSMERAQRALESAASTDPDKGGVCPGFGGVDGNLRFALMGCLVLEFLFGNWANNEPVIIVGLLAQRASWSGLPSSYNFSLYFLLCLGATTVLSRSCASSFMLAFFTVVSIVQDWILLAVYWAAMSSALSAGQPESAQHLLQFTRFSLIATHAIKAAVVALSMMIFSRRGGLLNTRLRGLPHSTYQRMRGRTDGGALY